MTTGAVERRARLAHFDRLCRAQGLPLTVQRRSILEALLGRTDHPTADQVFDEVRPDLPAVSRTTVYRVLETLVRMGVARKVSHPGAAARFETRTDRHHHLACTRCGRVVDLEAPSLNALRLPAVRGFHVTDYSVHVAGVCARCRRSDGQPTPKGRKGRA